MGPGLGTGGRVQAGGSVVMSRSNSRGRPGMGLGGGFGVRVRARGRSMGTFTGLPAEVGPGVGPVG